MPRKTKLNLKHLTIIEESEVPKPVRYTPYRALLRRIRKGKALVLSNEELNIGTARAGIRRLQKRGEFKHIVLRQARGKDDIIRLYVINPSEEKTGKE